MALKIDLRNPRRSDPSLLSSPVAAEQHAAMDLSRSSSSSGTARRLVFRGQGVNIVLPNVIPEITWEISDILDMVSKIHKFGKDEVCVSRGAFVDYRLYKL